MTSFNQSKTSNIGYQIKLDIEQDAINWYEGCNRISKGVDWKQRVPSIVYDNIFGKSKDAAYKFLIPFLKQKYVDEKDQIDKYISFVDNEYEQNFSLACQKIASLTDKPLYRKDFTVFLTTFPRGPYNYDMGYLWLVIGRKDPIKNFLHELLHFQFIHYWCIPESDVAKLNNEEFEWLKESLTVVLDEDLYPLIKSPDDGYELHREFRKELHKVWKTNKNFDELVKFGLKALPSFIIK